MDLHQSVNFSCLLIDWELLGGDGLQSFKHRVPVKTDRTSDLNGWNAAVVHHDLNHALTKLETLCDFLLGYKLLCRSFRLCRYGFSCHADRMARIFLRVGLSLRKKYQLFSLRRFFKVETAVSKLDFFFVSARSP